jgi:hypothetical protein
MDDSGFCGFVDIAKIGFLSRNFEDSVDEVTTHRGDKIYIVERYINTRLALCRETQPSTGLILISRERRSRG